MPKGSIDSQDVDRYLSEKEPEFRLRQAHGKVPSAEEKASFYYEYAQLLVAVGRQTLALPHFSTYLKMMDHVKEDAYWSPYYCSVRGQYASVLDYLGQSDAASEAYEAVMAINPNGLYIGDYAVFMHRKKKSYDKAEELYKKALDLFPFQSSIHLKYAGFLRHVRRNIAEAEKYYIKAVEVNPKNGDALGNYASFLHGVYNKIDEAEGYYVKAIEVDDTNTNNLCNYGESLLYLRGIIGLIYTKYTIYTI